MKQTLLAATLLLTSVAFADTIPFDSAALHNKIVNTTNGVISAIPTNNPVSSGIKVALISVGSIITGFFIGYFKKRNKAK